MAAVPPLFPLKTKIRHFEHSEKTKFKQTKLFRIFAIELQIMRIFVRNYIEIASQTLEKTISETTKQHFDTNF